MTSYRLSSSGASQMSLAANRTFARATTALPLGMSIRPAYGAPESERSGTEEVDWNHKTGKELRLKRDAGPDRPGQLVPFRPKPVRLQRAGGRRHDPVVRDAGPRVPAHLHRAVARLSAGGEDLHHQVRRALDPTVADQCGPILRNKHEIGLHTGELVEDDTKGSKHDLPKVMVTDVAAKEQHQFSESTLMLPSRRRRH